MTGLMLAAVPFAKSIHISPRLNAAYVNNPKVACSTLKLTLQQAELDYKPPLAVHAHEVSPLVTWPDITPTDDLLKGLFVFSFVRNPYARLRSAYLNKIVRPQKNGAFRKQAGFAADEVPSFRDFVLAVCAQEPKKQDPHWRLQALNLSVGRISYDFIGHLETFNADWEKLRAHLSLPANATFAGKANKPDDAQALLFDKYMKNKVKTSYATDFLTFGYDTKSI